MKIDLTELLKETGNELEIDDKFAMSFPEDGLVINSPVKIKLHLVNTDGSVIAKGSAKALLSFTCGRCLKEFTREVKTDIEELYSKELPDVSAGAKEVELAEEDIVFPIERDNTIDLTEAVRQDLLTAIPIKTICDESCRGLVEVKKGERKKTDPRLAKLKEFKRRKI